MRRLLHLHSVEMGYLIIIRKWNMKILSFKNILNGLNLTFHCYILIFCSSSFRLKIISSIPWLFRGWYIWSYCWGLFTDILQSLIVVPKMPAFSISRSRWYRSLINRTNIGNRSLLESPFRLNCWQGKSFLVANQGLWAFSRLCCSSKSILFLRLLWKIF